MRTPIVFLALLLAACGRSGEPVTVADPFDPSLPQRPETARSTHALLDRLAEREAE